MAAYESATHDVDKHTKTGVMLRSLTIKPVTGGYWIGHNLQEAPHALFVHWGTRPHPIYPKEKKALRFPVKGKFVFAQKVNHPGYKGDAWLVRARDKAMRIIQSVGK